jgi:penicillin-binding protein 1A
MPCRSVAKRKTAPKTKPKPGRRWPWKRYVFALLLGAALAVCCIYASWAGLYDLKQLEVMPQRSLIFDCNGQPFARRAGENRVLVPISKVSPYFIDALLAREDSRFYQHPGVDPVGILRAIFRNIVHLKAREGASTLTQQLARNSFQLGGKNLHRKLLEAFISLRIERKLSKSQILEFYVNRIYFGSGMYGVETASRAYFNKPCAKLTLGEAAVLAGLIRSPERFSPFRNLEASLKQRDTVLDRMVQTGKLTAEKAAQAKTQPVEVASTRPPSPSDGYPMGAIEDELNANLDSDQLAEGGLRIYTTLDPALQKAAEAALDTELAKVEVRPGYAHPKRADFGGRTDGASKTPYLQGALLLLDNATGGIRAMAGGRNYAESTYNRIYAKRQIGSTFKPFVYAAAFASGAASPSTPISDDAIRRGEIRGAPNWHPSNSDGSFRGVLPAEEGLVHSRNTMSARVGNLAGLDAVCQVAKDAGLGDIPHFPAVYLGAFECSLRDLVSAYTLFPNGGMRRQPFLIWRVEDARGKVIYRSNPVETRALSPSVCWMITGALQKVMERGTAASADYHKQAAGKTGTTNDYKDAWFVGYTAALTCGVWVGLDEPAPIMPHGYGAALALPVWCDVMNAAGDRYASRSFQQPDGSQVPGASPGAPDHTGEPVRKPLPSRIFNTFRHLFGGGN